MRIYTDEKLTQYKIKEIYSKQCKPVNSTSKNGKFFRIH